MNKKFKVYAPENLIKGINNLVNFPYNYLTPLKFVWIFDTSTDDPVYGTTSVSVIRDMINYYKIANKLTVRFIPYSPSATDSDITAQFKSLIMDEKFVYFCHGLTSTETQRLQTLVFSKYIGKAIVLNSYATSPTLINTDNLLRVCSTDDQLIDLLGYYLTNTTYVIIKANENPLFTDTYTTLLNTKLTELGGKTVYNYTETNFNTNISTIVTILNTTPNSTLFFVGFDTMSPLVDALLDAGLSANVQVMTSDSTATEILTAQTYAYITQVPNSAFIITNFFILDDFYTYILANYPNASPYILNNRSEIFLLFYIASSGLSLENITNSRYVDQRFFTTTRTNETGQFSLNTYSSTSVYNPYYIYQQIAPSLATYGTVQSI